MFPRVPASHQKSKKEIKEEEENDECLKIILWNSAFCNLPISVNFEL